jgi:hypothetical protein
MSGCSWLQMAVLTGQSDPRRCALSPLQANFLAAVAPERCIRIQANFPYWTDSPAYRATSLAAASFNNGWMYLRSRRRGFREIRGAGVEELVDRHPKTIFLTGSCGLEIFNNLRLSSELMNRVSIFAYGPVARRLPDCDHVLIGSSRDRLSRHFFPNPDHVVECGHLDYLVEPAVLALCRDFVQRVVNANAPENSSS